MSNKLKCIDGYTWAVGANQEVYKRIGLGQWVMLNNGLLTDNPLSDQYDDDEFIANFFNRGFSDIDGFSQKDIYAVGGQGDIWHFDGELWRRCGFPTNRPLSVVCCGKDGYVYVCDNAHIWRGREDNWEKICELGVTTELCDARWFKNQLWITSESGIFIWDGCRLQNKVIYKNNELPLSGRMDANENTLVIASLTGVWLYDGVNWYNTVPNFN